MSTMIVNVMTSLGGFTVVGCDLIKNYIAYYFFSNLFLYYWPSSRQTACIIMINTEGYIYRKVMVSEALFKS